jgi:nucleotide-binding universal stress UspA family protein
MGWKSIWLATDLAEGAEAPWTHALRLAKGANAPLTVVHANPSGSDHPWHRLPPAEELLPLWGFTQPSPETLALDVRFKGLAGRPTEAIPIVMDLEPPDLLVLGSHDHDPVERLVLGSVSKALANDPAPDQVLVVPDGAQPFVDPETGAFIGKRILIPVDETPDQQLAVDAAATLARAMAPAPIEFVLLHRGKPERMIDLDLPDGEGWWWRPVHERGTGVVPMVLEHAQDASAVVMLTRGHNSLIDTLVGSQTERVLRECPVPVLIVRPA